jgi:predicted acetyltransferase
MDFVELIVPRADLEASHRSFVAEFRARNEELVPWVIGEPSDDFGEYVTTLLSATNGVGLPPGWVPHSTFWLIDGNRQIVAVANLRHALTDYLRQWGGHIGYGVRPSMRGRGFAVEVLRRTLLHARALGLQKIRLICDNDNEASRKTILRNGGEFDDEAFMPGQQQAVLRYWISLT